MWKQTPFVALLVAGAMASLDRSTIEAARNLGASRPRILVEIVVPQVRQTLLVGLILCFVIMMSVLSVPLMINAQSPTMITANMAFRINAYGDYGVANALGLISYLMTGAVSWIYLRYGARGRGTMSACPRCGDGSSAVAPRPSRLRHFRPARQHVAVDGHGAMVLSA